jgi:hypothetical protein
MPTYMLLLYAQELDGTREPARFGEMSEWLSLTAGMREAGLLISKGSLRPVYSATSVRVRRGETELTDGPFAVTDEALAGYYLLNCRDLDHAIEQAARMPTARYGSVEVRPMIEISEITSEDSGAWPPA